LEGLKKSAGAVTGAVCLGMLVAKKRMQIRRIARPVPPRVLVWLVRAGKRVRISIPTDIEELAKGTPHAPFNLARGVRAFNRNSPNQGVPGAACCVVVDANQPADRFVLGCHHVLALSLLTGVQTQRRRSVGLDPARYGTHSVRRTKATLIYKRTKNIRAIQLLLGHTKLDYVPRRTMSRS